MKAYYGSRLSPNMTETPEGYLICLNVPIARTGSQKYLRSELGFEDDPNRIVTVWRTEDEVFSPATIASFEGKPVTDDHPPSGVYADNITAYDNGHVQNVRRGAGENRDLLIADLFITSPKLIDAIRAGRREVSCGYDCEYRERDGQIYQCTILGNHVAVVESGRAGSRVAIKDSASVRKERGKSIMSRKHSLFAQLFSRAVKDMEPDEVADAIEELASAEDCRDEEPEQTGKGPMPFPAADEGAATLEGLAAAVKALTEKVDALSAAHDEEPAEVPAPADPLEKLADELANIAGGAIGEQQPTDAEEATTIPPEELPETADADGPVAEASTLPENPIPGADRAIAALAAIRPVIAALPREQRKAAADRAVAEIRKLMGRDARPQAGGYAALNRVIRSASRGRANDSRTVQAKIGENIMASRNPHYKK